MNRPSPVPDAGAPIAVVMKGWPRLSETFIAREMAGLEARGLKLAIWALRHPTDKATHPVHGRVKAPISYLPEYLHRAPLTVLRAYLKACRLPGFRDARRIWLRDFRRDPTRNRIRRFGQACVLATQLPAETKLLYVHFMHTPGSVARYAGRMRGLPFSVSAHAKDIWTIPEWEVAEKLEACQWLTTCSRINAEHLRGMTNDPDKVALIYHGLEASYLERGESGSIRDAAPAVPTILSVGRAVTKKGYDDLLNALARLPADLSWRFVHVGGGDKADMLKAMAQSLGLDDRITWRGAQPESAVMEAYRSADLFVLASKIASDGDRDGLPNVLMEAQSQGLACVATQVSAIPELIVPEESGLLVPPGDPEALAEALRRVLSDPALRRRLGKAGQVRVRQDFSNRPGLDRLAALLARDAGLSLPNPAQPGHGN